MRTLTSLYRKGSRVFAVLVLGAGSTTFAATLCVNPLGNSGCSSTISAAVAAAQSGDTIQVSPGKYAESVKIGKPLTLIGTGGNRTVIDASGLANGIYIDGLDNPGLSEVSVQGFTVMSANLEGILITNASKVTISENVVDGNNRALNYSAHTCPGLPSFETNEGDDCGEGIHLAGVDHSVIQGNDVEGNAGGILITDETAANHDNLISGNTVSGNGFDCGITLASHAPSPQSGSMAPFGVYNNIISGNNSSNNGLNAPGAGAGVGIFAPGPGNRASGNIVINNTLTNNGLPGVTMHNHAAPPGAPAANLNDNQIIGNTIIGNAADTEDAETGGPTGINLYSLVPVTGTVVSQNIIDQEQFDIVFNAPGQMDAHLNWLKGGNTGVATLGTGSVNATLNYWDCPSGPGTMHCSSTSGNVTYTPVLQMPLGQLPVPRPYLFRLP